MRYVDIFREGMYIADVCLCRNKQIVPMKNGKEYGNLVTRDKTGTIDAKIWDLGSPEAGKFETIDYIRVGADVTLFQNSFQLSVCRIRKAQEGECVEADYLPVSKKDIKKTYEKLLGYVKSVKNPYPQKLLCGYFAENTASAKAFQPHSVTKTVHHGFAGGLLEHTLNVTRLCDYYTEYYPMVNRGLLLTVAIFHDTDKTRELSRSPENDYTDDGQLLGHVIIGTEMVGEGIRPIPGSPEKLAIELRHYIPAHHGELKCGSPRKSVLLKALAPNLADNTGAKMETIIEAPRPGGDNKGRLGRNRLLESNIEKIMEQASRLDNKEEQQDRAYKAENI